MAVIRKRKRRQGRAQLKVRLPEELRREIELAAAESHHSMNSEIVRRLKLFGQSGSAKLDAEPPQTATTATLTMAFHELHSTTEPF